MGQTMQYIVHYIEPRDVKARLEFILSKDCQGNDTTIMEAPVIADGRGEIVLGENKLCNVLLVVGDTPLPYRELSVPDYGVLRYLYVYPNVRALIDILLLIKNVTIRIETDKPLTIHVIWPEAQLDIYDCRPPNCVIKSSMPVPSKSFRIVVTEHGLLTVTHVYERGILIESKIEPQRNLHVVLPPLLIAMAYSSMLWYKQYRRGR